MHATDRTSSALSDSLLLRRISSERQHIAETMAARAVPAGCTWWELTDTTADLDQLPTAVAVTRVGVRQVVHVELLATRDLRSERILVRLLTELLAALRRTDAVSVSMSSDDQTVAGALRAVGFTSARCNEAARDPYTLPL